MVAKDSEPYGYAEARIQQYSVGTDTPRFLATSRGGTPLAKSFLADSILLSVIWSYTTKLSGDFQSCTGMLDCKFTFHFSQLAITW